MLDVIGQLVPYAVGVALSPLPVIAILLLLLSPGGRAAATAFLAVRVMSVTAVAGGAALLTELLPESNGTSPAAAWLRIILGVALIGLAIKKWTGRPVAGADVELPTWMASIEGMSTAGAARLGFILSAINLKELAFGVGAGLIAGGAGLSVGATLATVLIYVALACLSVVIPVAAFVFAGARAEPPLRRARTWLIDNNAVVIAVVLLVIGAILIGNGLTTI